MKKVYAAGDQQEINEIKAFLEGKGIPVAVQGEHLNMVDVLGFTPQIAPMTIWTLRDEDYENACELVREYVGADPTPEVDETPWTCDECKEEIEGQFDQCWNCGKARTDVV